MPEDDILRKIEARLTRLEATLSQQGATPNVGAVVDSVPWPGGGWGGGWWGGGRPHPIVDSATFAQQYRHPTPTIVDWGPWGPWGPNVDSATYAGAAPQAFASAFRRPGPGPVIDPPPIDVSRFSVEQLEAALHSINAEKARLNSVETMIRQQLDKRQQER